MTELNQQIMIAISEIRFHDGTELQNNISGISVNQRKVGIVLEIPPNKIQESENIRREVEEAISKLDWVKQVTVAFTNKQISDADSKSKLLLDQVKKVILVLSGKGGVGKSTISALIADRLTSMGYKIGLLDADIQGPSIHRIFPTLEPIKIIDHKFLPALVRDVQIMSIGYLYDYALPWRGPMISKTLYKLLSLTAWQKLDYLIIDTPPGMSDVHLSIFQNYQIDAAVAVTSPQLISKIDVKKSIDTLLKFKIPLLGIIENMSGFKDATDNLIRIFPGSGAQELAYEYKVPLIASVAIITELSEATDAGRSLNTLKIDLPIEQYLL